MPSKKNDGPKALRDLLSFPAASPKPKPAEPPVCPKCGRRDGMTKHADGRWACHNTHLR